MPRATEVAEWPEHWLRLNAVCPYYTMFPLDFPLGQLELYPDARYVLDPFCGRGTTLFAARLTGRRAVGASIAVLRQRFDLVITSPPYYGMRTYVPDQWLRNWFLGGPPGVPYGSDGQLAHQPSQAAFVAALAAVWHAVAARCTPGARLVIRFGQTRTMTGQVSTATRPT